MASRRAKPQSLLPTAYCFHLPPNRNGAGIAADPTLTGVWTAPRREPCLTPGALPQAGCGTLARRSRRCRSAGGWGWCRHRSLAVPAVRDRGRPSRHLKRPRLCQGALALPSVAGPGAIRPFASGGAQCDALSGFGMALAGGSLCPTGFALCFTFASTRFRELAVALDRQGVPSLRFRALSRFDVRRMRAPDESGKTGRVALIHFWHKGQWTRVDKSTLHRKPGGCGAKTGRGGAVSGGGRAGRAGANGGH